MTIRADLTELLHAGYGDRTIARQIGVSIGSVTRARTELGIPKARGGTKAAGSPEDVFWRRTQPVDGGHYQWNGGRNSKGTPTLGWNRGHYSAYRIAYKIRHGVEPTGYAFPACDYPSCIAPDHIGDSAVSARPAHHGGGTGRPPNASRADIVRLIRKGHSNREIGIRLRTAPRKVATIRAELGLPRVQSRPLTFEDRWAANTEQVGDHVRWTGRLRDGRTPFLLHEGVDSSVRRVVFERVHGRVPVGLVLPGCGRDDCVRPEHLEDQPMRAALRVQYAAIFGVAS